MYNTILFDLDGTLTDPGLGITNSVAHALAKWDIHVADRTSLYKFIGPPLADSFAKYYGFSPEDCTRAIEAYREYFRDRGLYENEVYPGIPELLAALRQAGKTVAVATSKPEEFAIRILKHFDLDHCFDLIAGATMDGSRSRKADVIAYALEKLDHPDLSQTIMIGDREQDILGARQIGIASIGVLYGYGDRPEHEKAGANYIAETVEDILPLL